MNISFLADIESSFKSFFVQLSSALGFGGLLALTLAVEFFFVFLFVLKTFYSYEMRLGRALYKLNSWLFEHKKIDQSNIKEFNNLVKKCPKRVLYYWQQFILFRENGPTYYLSLDNLVEKPLKTSGWANNIKNLNFVTVIWAGITLLLSIAYQASSSSTNLTSTALATAIAFPVFVVVVGIIANMFLKSKKISNLDDIYQNYHIFARFISNACIDLPAYIDFDLLFSSEEIAKGNPQLREYYENRARKAKEEFENAKKSDVEYVEYNFENAGVDGSLVLERAMKETEAFINKKTSTQAKIAHAESEKEAIRRNYENIQKDLQRKIQACKENIAKYIQAQEATTNRMEVGFIRKQQDQEIAKQESLQNEYDQEETKFALSVEELNQEIAKLREQLDASKEAVQKAMVAEYQTFYEKVMKSVHEQVELQVAKEKQELIKERDNNERELIVVQTQIKRLVDENDTLRARLGDEQVQGQNANDGVYDEEGNYVYKDGSYHDPNGLFHDVDGKIYDMNGTLISTPKSQEEKEKESAKSMEAAFGKLGQDDKPQDEKKSDKKKLENAEEVKVEKKVEEDRTKDEVEKVVEPVTAEETSTVEVKEETPKEKPEKEISKTESKPSGKRGRPRKVVTEPIVKEKKPVGRPRKTVTEVKEKKPVGRPRKEASATKNSTKPAAKKAVKKETNSEDRLASLEKINAQISKEEDRLNKMKMLISSEIDEAIENSQTESINNERDKIIKEIEALQAQAQQVKLNATSEELSKVNARIEALLKEISNIDNV